MVFVDCVIWLFTVLCCLFVVDGWFCLLVCWFDFANRVGYILFNLVCFVFDWLFWSLGGFTLCLLCVVMDWLFSYVLSVVTLDFDDRCLSLDSLDTLVCMGCWVIVCCFLLTFVLHACWFVAFCLGFALVIVRVYLLFALSLVFSVY